jgi:hypothetical protein
VEAWNATRLRQLEDGDPGYTEQGCKLTSLQCPADFLDLICEGQSYTDDLPELPLTLPRHLAEDRL